ncbi:MAG: hypothetical protein CL910_21425 [Deltaproteobacteria bacterium]|jgi:cytochrome c553|nr:hypothetical protein [Deltaproteobacteria bacterium]
MRCFRSPAFLWTATLLALGSRALAYPGGTPDYQTDAAPFCSSCHSSRSASALAGAPGDRATKELAENKHLALIRAGEQGYGELSAEDRATLVQHIQALDAASTVAIGVVPKARPGEEITVKVQVKGGAGPVVGVGLVDRAHRWQARPIASAGWQVVGAPRILGQDFQEQTRWLGRRPASSGHNLSFVNVEGIRSDAAAGEWGRAEVVWKLRAPSQPGAHPLVAAYWYGTEKGSPLGVTEDPIRGKLLRGGFAGGSGRVLFSEMIQVRVQ